MTNLDELVRRAISNGRALVGGATDARMKKALEKARELAASPTTTDPNLPKWWEYEAPKGPMPPPDATFQRPAR